MPLLVAQAASVEPPALDWAGLLPVLLPAAGAVALLMIRALLPPSPSPSPPSRDRPNPPLPAPAVFDAAWTFALAAAGLVAVAVQWNRLDGNHPIAAFGDQFVSDGFSLFVTAVVFASVAMVALVLPRWCQQAGIDGAEVYVLLLLSASGAVVMAGAGDLIVMFLGLETLSIAAYVMAAIDRRRLESLEAGMKYFVLGAFSSAFLLYGIALVYGAAGTTSLAGIGAHLETAPGLGDGLLPAGLALMLVGLGFKVAAVPFHAWLPDVYQGSPAPITAFMASAVKAAGFAALVRVFAAAMGLRAGDWQPAVFALACATLVTGSVLAAAQDDVKRLLAYSSISHAGFILVGVQAASDNGVAAVLFYLAAYSVIAVGSFTVLGVLPGPGGGQRVPLRAVAGLGARRPALALAFTVLLLAQAGVPFTSGFAAKLSVVSAAAEARSFWLAAVAMVSAVVAAFAYLRVVVAMYFGPARSDDAAAAAADRPPRPAADRLPRPAADRLPRPAADRPRLPLGAAAVIAFAVAVTLAVGVFPGTVDTLAREAASHLVG